MIGNHLLRVYRSGSRLLQQLYSTRAVSRTWVRTSTLALGAIHSLLFVVEGRCSRPLVSVSWWTAIIPCHIVFKVVRHLIPSWHSRQFFQNWQERHPLRSKIWGVGQAPITHSHSCGIAVTTLKAHLFIYLFLFIYLLYKITLFTPLTLQYSIYSTLFTSLQYKKTYNEINTYH